TDSRLTGLNDFYLVGRDRSTFVEWFGAIAIWGGLAGVGLHLMIRLISIRRRKAQADKEFGE
ncbi:hypothetical protein AB4585_29295, partial [Vibrio sp. 10N.222.49.C9]